MTKTLLAPPAALEFKELKAFQTKVLDEVEGIVEAMVAVTGNEDDGGDVILPKAFEFPEGRNPKIVWSHDLQVLCGKVLEAEELLAGDVRLPEDMKAKGLGALVFKLQFDLLDPDGFKAWRRVVFHEDLGWSIGYQVPTGAAKMVEGRRHLSKVVVWEASPVTFGMNREARTLTVKDAFAHAAQAMPEAQRKVIEGLLEGIAAMTEDEAKTWPPVAGSLEERAYLIRQAIDAWAVEEFGEREEGNYWWVYTEATFEDRVVVSVEKMGEDRYWLEFPATVTEDGVDLGAPTEVVIETSVSITSGTKTAGRVIMPKQVEEKAKAHKPHAYAKADDGDDCAVCGQATGSALHDEKAIDAEKALAGIETEVAYLVASVSDAKAGRVLARRNEARIRAAMAAIEEVLGEVTSTEDDDKDGKVVDPPTPIEGKAVTLEDLDLIRAGLL